MSKSASHICCSYLNAVAINPLFSFEVVLEQIAALTSQIQHCRKLDDILQETIADARSLLNTDRILIYRLLPDQDAVIAFESVGTEWAPLLGQLIYDPCFEAIWVERYQQGQTTSISDLHSGSIAPCHVQLLERLQVQANLVVPILHQDTLWGLLIAHHCCSPREWQSLEVTYLQQVALHLGLAIQQAELRQSHERLEAALEHHSVEYPPASFQQRSCVKLPSEPETDCGLVACNLALQVNHCALWNWNLLTNEMFLSSGWKAIRGYADDELENDWEEWSGCIHPDDRDRVMQSVQAHLGDRTSTFEQEYRVQHRDGSCRWVLSQGQAVWNEAGTPLRLAGTETDITIHKQTGARLQESEARFRVMSDCAPVLLWMAGLDGLCDFLNQGWLNFTGRTLEQERGHGWAEGVHPDDLERCLHIYLTAFQAHQSFEMEYRLRRADGEYRWILDRGTPRFAPDGGFAGFIGSCIDISDRKAAEIALRQSQHQWYTLFHSLDDFLLVVDAADGRLLIVNAAMENRLGYSQAELLTMRVLDLHPTEQRQEAAQIVADMLAGHRTLCTIPLMTKDGSYIPVETKVKLDTWEGRPALLAICRDVSDRVAAEASLRQSEAKNRAMLAAIPDLLLRVTRDGICLDFIPPIASEAGSFVPIQQHLAEVLPPDLLQYKLQRMEQALATGELQIWEHQLLKAGKLCDEEIRLIPCGADEVLIIVRDITDRKQTQLQLQLQSTALEACVDTIMITDKDGIIEWVNPAFTEITGFSLQEAIGKNPRDLVKSGYQNQAFYQALWATITSGQTWWGEMINRRKDGSLYTVAETITPIHNQQDQISHFIAIKRDITERKRLEQVEQQRIVTERVMNQIIHDMRQSLDVRQVLNTVVTEVRQFLKTDRVLIYQLYPDWQGVVVAESAAPEWLAILSMEITDSYFVETQGGTYHDKHINVVPDVSAAGFSPCHLELLERLQVRAKLVVPISYEDRIWGLLIAHQCCSVREWQLFEVELMSQLTAHMTIAVQQAELHQQVQTLNTNLELQVQERTAQLQQALDFEALLKRITDQVRDSLDEEQILQRVVQELTISMKVEGCDTALYNADRTTTTVRYDYRQDGCVAQASVYLIANSSDPHLYVQLFQGHYCHFCLIGQNVVRPDQPRRTILACPIMDDQGIWGDMWLFKPSHDVFNDLEVRLVQQIANQCAIALRQSRLYQAAQTQVQELERLNCLKDDFLNTVSHELRSPMSSIRMATKMLEISLKPLGVLDDQSNAIQRYFKVLHEEGEREINLINDLLDLARLDTGTEPLNLITISLQFYIPHLAESLSERARQQQQQLVFHIPEAFPPFTTDLQYLERILTELLYNACKYTPAGGTITVSAQSHGEVTEIRVSNTGVEIPAVECDRIFDKFYRIPNNDPWKHGGTGLGLALVKKLTERLGGQIHAESGGDQTTFVLKLVANLV